MRIFSVATHSLLLLSAGQFAAAKKGKHHDNDHGYTDDNSFDDDGAIFRAHDDAVDDAFLLDDDGAFFPIRPQAVVDDGAAFAFDDDGAIVPLRGPRTDDDSVIIDDAFRFGDDRVFAPLTDDTFRHSTDDGIFPLITPVGVPAGIFGGDVGPIHTAACSAVPACAHLDGDCCPTSTGGMYLDCCHSAAAPTAAACSAHPGCAGLDGDCCPSSTGLGKDLYCCYQTPSVGGSGYYRPDVTLYGHPYLDHQAVYWTSTGQHTEFQNKNDGSWTIEYVGDGHSQYDLVYFRTDAILDPHVFVTGERKFYLTIESTTAPPCAQIMLQLDHIPTAQADNYPAGRHSRYLATYDASGGRLEFDFWDRPDTHITQVNAIALLFEPGVFTDHTWRWSMLDMAVACDPTAYTDYGCAPSPVKRCPAVHVGATECACDNPACWFGTDYHNNDNMCSIAYTESYLALDATNHQTISGTTGRHALALGLLVSVVISTVM